MYPWLRRLRVQAYVVDRRYVHVPVVEKVACSSICG